MKFLVDANLSPGVATYLRDAGHDAVHLFELGLHEAPDLVVLDHAQDEGRVLLTADTDFGAMLAERGTAGPSVVLVRRRTHRRAERLAMLLLANLPALTNDLAAGAIVVLHDNRIRARRLPLIPREQEVE